MAVGNVTLSGGLVYKDNSPVVGKKISVYSLPGSFKAVHIKDFNTEKDGSYKLEYPLKELNEPLVFICHEENDIVPIFKKFISISANKHKIDIPSPPIARKKQKANPHRLTRKDSTISFHHLAKSTIGKNWQAELTKFLPDVTTEIIQNSYRYASFSLSNERAEIKFINNTLFFNAPTHSEKERKSVHTVSSFKQKNNPEGRREDTPEVLKRNIPEVEIEIQHRLAQSIMSVSIRYQDGEWIKAAKNDPDYEKLLYIANSSAILIGLATRGLAWGYVYPSMYAQAFLTAISEKNPLHQFLGLFLNDDFLIGRHLGMPFANPLIDLLTSSGLKMDEIQQLTESSLVTPYILQTDGRAKLFCDLIIEPFVTKFFEYHSEIIRSKHWEEIFQLSKTFAALHPRETQQNDLKPFIDNPIEPVSGDIANLKIWCKEALFYTLFMPFELRESMMYLTDLEFASLNPKSDEIQDAELPQYGGTSPENALMQLPKVRHFLETKRSKLLSRMLKLANMPKMKEKNILSELSNLLGDKKMADSKIILPVLKHLNELLENNAVELKKKGVNVYDL